jgi:O-antigen ligase
MLGLLGLGIIIGGSLLALFSLWAWDKVSLKWLQNICAALIVSLPFERIPSVSIAGANLRPSQVIVMAGLWCVALLWWKKDVNFVKLKPNYITWWLVALIVLSIPSWFVIQDTKRFLVTGVATLLCFGATFLIANFAGSVWKNTQRLLVSMLAVTAFAGYQFLADMISVPYYLTGLREQYTQRVFGFPRVHATALEPLYFAGMLFLPILATFLAWLAHQNILKWRDQQLPNPLLFAIFMSFLVLTISKSAYLAIVLTLGITLMIWAVRYSVLDILKNLAFLAILGLFVLFVTVSLSPQLATGLNNVVDNFEATISGRSVSAMDRSRFLTAALVLLPEHISQGIGSGQYGVVADPLLRDLAKEPGSYLIVNNVYVEVWLENGFVFLVVFVLMFINTLWQASVRLARAKDWTSEGNLVSLILVFSLLAYLIQWTTFSPIYIMPIFILLGMLARQNQIQGLELAR